MVYNTIYRKFPKQQQLNRVLAESQQSPSKVRAESAIMFQKVCSDTPRTVLGLSSDWSDFPWTGWTFLGLSQDFPRTVLGLSQDFPRTVLGLSQDFLRTVLGLSSDCQDCPRTVLRVRQDMWGRVKYCDNSLFSQEFKCLSGNIFDIERIVQLNINVRLCCNCTLRILHKGLPDMSTSYICRLGSKGYVPIMHESYTLHLSQSW